VKNIRSVYASAGEDFSQTAYVECHGTGTQAGDWRELKAISESVGSNRAVDNPVIVGSLKTNIGHLEGAAGVAGMIKGVLTLEKGMIPPNINFEKGNPSIDFKDWRVKVPLEMTPWPRPGLRRVSVNCFGFGGTNAHVILDEAPKYLSERGLKGNHTSATQVDPNKASKPKEGNDEGTIPTLSIPNIFVVSSNERAGVRRVIDSQLEYINEKAAEFHDQRLLDYAYTLGCRRSKHEWKGYVVASSHSSLVEKLGSFDNGQLRRSTKDNVPSIGFVFCGQGSQWAQMGRDLMSFDAFRDSIQGASKHMRTFLCSPFDLLEEIFKDDTESRINDPEISQPATTALQVALVDLLDSCYITPDAVVGHSSGEIAAAFASRAITREAAWEIAYYRGLAASHIRQKNPILDGGMMAVGLSAAAAQEYLRENCRAAQVACINSPRLVTLSGDKTEITGIAEDLAAKKTFYRILGVNIAYHSSHMKIVEEEYRAALRSLSPTGFSQITRMFSSVTGKEIAGNELGASYWAKNMVSQVQFVDAVKAMMASKDRPDIIVELSPGATLKSPLSDILLEINSKSSPAYLSIMNRLKSSDESTLEAFGEIWAHGYPVDMVKVVSKGSYQASYKVLTDLPPYPWNHTKSYWHESHLGVANRFREYPRMDLIGAPTADSIPFEPRWRGFLRIGENPWIQDHQVQKTVIYPAAGMIVMVIEGAQQMVKDNAGVLGFELSVVRIEKAMIIPSTAHGLEVALNIKQNPGGYSNVHEFALYSKPLDSAWQKHASGTLTVMAAANDCEYADSVYEDASDGWTAMSAGDSESLQTPASSRTFTDDIAPKQGSFYQDTFNKLTTLCDEDIVPRQLYEVLDIVGMNYGPSFQNIIKIAKSGSSCVSKVRIPDTKSKMPAKFEYPHLIHPATLDAMFQTLFAIDSEPMVPSYIESIFISANTPRGVGQEFNGYATAERVGIRDATANMVMASSDWDRPSVVVKGLHFTGLAIPSVDDWGFLPNNRTLCTEIEWKEDFATAETEYLNAFLGLVAHKHPDLAILVIDCDTELIESILNLLGPRGQSPRLSRMTISSKNPAEDEPLGSDVAHLHSFVERRVYDEDSTDFPDYNVIIIGGKNVAVRDAMFKLLRPGGVILTERTMNLIAEPPRLSWPSPKDYPKKAFYKYTKPREAAPPRHQTILLILPDDPPSDMVALASHLADIFRVRGIEAVSTYWKSLGTQALGQVCISLLEAGVSAGLVMDMTAEDFARFYRLQATAKAILWVTRAGQLEKPKNPRAAAFLGLARTLMSEDPQKVIVTLDLAESSFLEKSPVSESPIARSFCLEKTSAAATIFEVFDRSIAATTFAGPRETEYAADDGKLFIPRLVPVTYLNRLTEKGGAGVSDLTEKPFIEHDPNNMSLGLRLVIEKTDGTFKFIEEEFPEELGPCDVEIEFGSAAIHPDDLDTARGRTRDLTIGVDVCGTVTRVGSSVIDFKAHDFVTAIARDGTIKTRVRTDVQFVKPSVSALQTGKHFNVAPSCYIAAFHAISQISGSRYRQVLIHAGASAAGMAAIQVAHLLGKDVIATVVGRDSDRQREILGSELGMSQEKVLSADADDFADQVQRLTDGKGVQLAYCPFKAQVQISFNCVRKCKEPAHSVLLMPLELELTLYQMVS
jgi:acyl transferase domain-containing protein/D-arabinose 1-dehydrogenase-like Zn-dependent alcohol dehydrogenase